MEIQNQNDKTCDICTYKKFRRPKNGQRYFQCWGTQKDVTVNALDKTTNIHCPYYQKKDVKLK